MSYLFYRVGRRLQHHRRVYLLVELEILIGVLLLSLSLNTAFSAQQRLAEYTAQAGGGYTTINIYQKEEAHTAPLAEQHPITAQDLEALGSLLPETPVQALTTSHIALQLTQETHQLTLVRLSPAYFSALFGGATQQNAAYAAPQLLAHLTQEQGAFYESWLRLEPGGLAATEGGEALPLTPLPPGGAEEIALSLSQGMTLQTSQCVFVPLGFAQADARSNLAQLRLAPGGPVQPLLDYLRQAHGELYNYEATDALADAARKVEDLSRQVDFLTVISALLFFVVMVGLIGILLIFLNHRKKDMALSVALGASQRRIQAELFWEVFILYLVGAGAGIAASLPLLPAISTVLYTVRLHGVTLAAAGLLCLFCTALVCANLVAETRGLKPCELLCGER